MIRALRFLPRSLVGRVFTLYAAVLLFFVGSGLGLFFQYRFNQELEETQQRSDSMVQIAAPAIADSAVIGDYDTIRRTLERATRSSDFASASFIDVNGGMVRVDSHDKARNNPPAWLKAQIAKHMYDTNLPINVGGRDYGVLRMSFAHDRIAAVLWTQALYALALAAAGLAGGLVLLRVPLGYWLNDLSRLQSFDESLRTGTDHAHERFGENAPIEFQQTFDVLKRAAASIQVQREQAAATLDAIGDAVLTLDAQGRIILVNPAASRMLARPSDALLNQPANEVIPQVFDPHRPFEPWRARQSHLNPGSGLERVVDSNLSAITGPHGEPHGFVLALRDVTERNALDQRLRSELSARELAMTSLRSVLEGLLPQSAGHAEPPPADDLAAVSQLISHLVSRLQERGEQLNAIFELSPDGFVSFDAQRRVNYMSPAFTRLTGLSEAQVLGLGEHQLGQLLLPQCAAGQHLLEDFEMLRMKESDQASGKRRRDLVELSRPTKRVLEVGLRQSQSLGISQLLHLRDVTHETEVEQMKSEFLSTAAHELRTPMASIFGFSELMLSRKLSDERQEDVLNTIHRQTQLMISIVNELLDLARIEARRGKDFDLEDLDLRGLTQDVVHDFNPPNDRPTPELHLPDEPMPVRVDRGKMLQAVGNVLSNAYKYSPGGGRVSVRVVSRVPADGRSAIEVGVEIQDEGIGMTPEQLSRVCERFYRADSSGSIPGTGLGMAIVKEIVELLGGSLALASEPGRGTTATLWLPKASAAEAPPQFDAALAPA